MSFSFRQIRYFVAISESGSLSKAAKHLSVSQSTVTEAIQELERDLGFKLFERSAQGVLLTLKGQHFLRHAQRILAVIADARGAFPATAAAKGSRLKLGVTPLVASYVLADLFARFRRAFPQLYVDAVEDSRDYLEHLLIGGELDVAVMVLPPGYVASALQAERIETSEYQIWLPAGHRLCENKTVSLGNLAGEPQILWAADEVEEASTAVWRQFEGRPTVSFRTRAVEAVRSLVATGAGFAVMPDLTYRPWSLEGDKIEARAIEERLPAIVVSVV